MSPTAKFYKEIGRNEEAIWLRTLLFYRFLFSSSLFISFYYKCEILKKLAAIKRSPEVRNQSKIIYDIICFSIDYTFMINYFQKAIYRHYTHSWPCNINLKPEITSWQPNENPWLLQYFTRRFSAIFVSPSFVLMRGLLRNPHSIRMNAISCFKPN